ncbi:uncharacterized protein EAF01_011435 [Botrytis porri]|uniref:Uncharacterized protein n=1 Tax=Botrytis porri TaxID=87229 RepID=A0A4Z1KE49_9HELO|nr:uncharacterized protein EAF01_011435 [Botrytis porri]KAF7885370.1 hypothetical protein EAF01_011435 [Botrytis porri]TGO84311.1 hypothetical protein BPOR_0521g00050 [Botrytis porri]
MDFEKDIKKDIEKDSFSSASSFTDEKATPGPVVAPKFCFSRLALRLFPKSRSGSSKSNCFAGFNANGSSQSLPNRLATSKGVQEKESGAASVTVGLIFSDFPSIAPFKDHYAIKTTSNTHLILEKDWVHGQAKPLLDIVFGKDSFQDNSAYPAAILPDYDLTVLAMFVQWINDCAHRSMNTHHMFKERVCTRQERVQTIDIIMEILFFAEQYALHEFQDDILEVLISSCKEDNLPLDVSHAYNCHERTTPNSKTRAFFIDLVAFIIQEIDTSRNGKKKKATLNCDLSSNNKKTLVKLIQLLEGSKIRSSRGKLSDPRDAPVCVYHYHGDKEECPHKAL